MLEPGYTVFQSFQGSYHLAGQKIGRLVQLFLFRQVLSVRPARYPSYSMCSTTVPIMTQGAPGIYLEEARGISLV